MNALAATETEVSAKAQRRRFTAEYKRKVLQEAEACTKPGEIAALLRREGLYSSHLTAWRRLREAGELSAWRRRSAGRRRGRRTSGTARSRSSSASWRSAWRSVWNRDAGPKLDGEAVMSAVEEHRATLGVVANCAALALARGSGTRAS